MKRLERATGYRVTEKLHEGRQTAVFRGVRVVDAMPVVIKLLTDDRPSPWALAVFEREFHMARELALADVVAVHALERIENTRFLVLEDTGGRGLDCFLAEGAVDVAQALQLAVRLAGILDRVHEAGVLHLDLCPENVVWNSETGVLKLKGFGRACRSADAAATETDCHRVEGLEYAAPEQTGRFGHFLDTRTDLYALGATLYSLFAGVPPFSADDPMDLVHAHLAKDPVPLHEVNPAVPPAVSDIVTKLLRKEPNERYQTAFGLACDLEASFAAYARQGTVEPFPLATSDALARLQIPERLYGRNPERAQLLEAFGRVRTGSRELVLIGGYSGAGKSALVQSLYDDVMGTGVLCLSGKFNEFQWNVPYFAFQQAFTAFCHYVLGLGESKLQAWKSELLTAVGHQGGVLTGVIPALALILGAQPPVDPISPNEAQNRFTDLFRRFLAVLCRREQPLALFLDDWQWADPASIYLLNQIARCSELEHLLVIAAYRSNEIGPGHDFEETARLRAGGAAQVTRIDLPDLAVTDVRSLLADTFGHPEEAVRELAELVMEKTSGNPFFVRVFLRAMHDEQLVVFDRGARQWHWALDRIRSMALTHNVADLLAGKVRRFPAGTQDVLKLAAATGSRFSVETLSIVQQSPCETCWKALRPAIDEGLVVPAGPAGLPRGGMAAEAARDLQFQHDRVREACYALIAEAARPETHLRIGRLLLDGREGSEWADRLFEVADHINAGAALVTDPDERFRFAALNLEAARTAKSGTAYAAALRYHEAAFRFIDAPELEGRLWGEQYEQGLALHRERAECEYLCGNFDQAEALIRRAVEQARTALDAAESLHVLIVQYTLQADYAQAIETGRQALALLGVSLPEDHYEACRDAELREFRRLLNGKPIDALVGLPRMTDPEMRTVSKLLITMGPPCYRWHQRLWAVIVPRVVSLCLRFGNIPQVGYSYPALGGLLGWVSNDYATAKRLGHAATRLMTETFQSPSDQCVFYLMIGSSLRHWSRHLRHSSEDYQEAYQIGLRSSNLQYAAYAFGHNMYCRFYQGIALDELLGQTEDSLVFSRTRRNQWAIDLLEGGRLVFAALSGRVPDRPEQNDGALLERYAANRNIQVRCIYLVMKAFTHYVLGDLEQALTRAKEADEILYTVGTQGLLPWAEHTFCTGLIHAALARTAPAHAQAEHLGRVKSVLEQLSVWSEHGPENFGHKHTLLAAELAALEGRVGEAMSLYDRAIASARDGGFIQYQAIANECAARFWMAQGKPHFARHYVQEADYGYGLWGADAKRLLLRGEFGDDMHWSGGSADHSRAARKVSDELDVATILAAAQDLAETVHLDTLLHKMMRLVLANAGGETGLLVLRAGTDWRIEATAGASGISVLNGAELVPDEAPTSIILHTARTREPLILSHPADHPAYAHDPYLQRKQPRSVCCLPLLRLGDPVGLLYLENGLAGGVFEAVQVQLLELLSSQMAMAIVNAQQYQHLERAVAERTAELSRSRENYRRLYDDSPVPLWVLDVSAFRERLEALESEANQPLLDYLSGAPEVFFACLDLVQVIQANSAAVRLFEEGDSAGAQWKVHSITCDESMPMLLRFAAFVAGHTATYETEGTLQTRSGTKVNLELRGSVLQHAEAERDTLLVSGVDITARRLAEAEQRRLESQLQHTQKLESLGVLAGGIAHDFNNLLAAISGHAELACEVLPKHSPAHEHLQPIMDAARGAASLCHQMLAYAGKTTFALEQVDLGELIRSSAQLLRASVSKRSSISMHVEAGLPLVESDPGQIRQIVLNLITNASEAIGDRNGLIRVSVTSGWFSKIDLWCPHMPGGCEPGRYVRLDVTDTGCGMDEATKQRIFEPFYTTKFAGRGLGLAAVLGMVKAHRGTLKVESALGEGTTISVLFPAAAVQPEAVGGRAAPSAPAAPVRQKAKGVAIIADDEDSVRALAASVLNRMGFTVLTASDGVEAVELYRAHSDQVQLVVLDLTMPRMDGAGAFAEIRRLDNDVPVIVASGYSVEDVASRFAHQQSSGFLQKPYRLAQMRALIAELVPEDSAN